jgi:mercuric ion transport protein
MQAQSMIPSGRPAGGGALFVGGVAAMLASTCCIGPLVLLAVGFSGAWIAGLTALEPCRPAFIALALVALFVAGRAIWRPAIACAPDEVCAAPAVKRTYKALFGVVVILVLVAIAFPFVAPMFY